MRFLAVTKANHPFPPEALAGLVDAMSGWIAKYTAEKKMEQSWSFAGLQGGGAAFSTSTPLRS